MPTRFSSVYPDIGADGPSYGAGTPLVDVWVTLGNIAAQTSRIGLGSGIFVLPLRNPFTVARAVATAQDLSGGRVLFGIGSGWLREEFDAVGENFGNRGSRTDEMLEVIAKLWTGGPVSHNGRWYSFDEVQLSPAPISEIPVIIGGASGAALARAARIAAGWYGPNCTLEESAAHREGLLRHLAEFGRDADQFQFYCRLPNNSTARDVEHAMKMGFRDLVISLPRSRNDLAATIEQVDEIAAGLDGYMG
jgi:probable F420-dependent oxidoreductase